MRVLSAIVLFVLWPFHRHQQAHPPQSWNASTMQFVGMEDATTTEFGTECEFSEDLGYVYVGYDGTVGTSHASCQAAFQVWVHNPPPNVWLQRS